MTTRVAINGFGRTGRQALKAIWKGYLPDLEIAAIGLEKMEDAAAAAHLLKYDSNYGRFGPDVRVADGRLAVGETLIPLVSAAEPRELRWREHGVDVVIEATGKFSDAAVARGHIEAGASKVVVTDQSAGADFTMIYGVNESGYDAEKHHVVCCDTETTNALAALLTALAGAFTIEQALVTAVRAYTNAQKLIDTTDVELRRARSAPQSIVPTSSRAATAVGAIVPELRGRIDGYSVRVPVPVVSILEVTLKLSEPSDAASINRTLRAAAAGPLGRVLAVSDEPLVSSDYRGCACSAVVDAPLTITIGPLAKVSAWYDNEWGYSSRVADVTAYVAAQLAKE